MKILSAKQIREADAYTLQNEPIKSIDLMERAAKKCFEWIQKNANSLQLKKCKIIVVCGVGNNGGDGLAIARMLHENHFKVEVWIVRFSSKCSKDFETNENLLKQIEIKRYDINNSNELPEINSSSVIIDSLFGTGLTRSVSGLAFDVINTINNSDVPVIAIDMPSGLMSEDNGSNDSKAIIKATFTLTFEFPKLVFFFAEYSLFVGRWQIIPIGLHKNFINKVPARLHYTTGAIIKEMLKKRNQFAHKGNFGHAMIIAGSMGKMGATVMASKACLRSGVGLLTVYTPGCGYQIIQQSVPEAMCLVDEQHEYFTTAPKLEHYNAIGIGPGIGIDNQTGAMLKVVIQNSQCPMIIDADAINILAENKTWIAFVPPNSIYTPHLKEFERLVGKTDNPFERLAMQREFSIKNRCIMVLKGAYSSISGSDGQIFFNSTGNPGMATGGSGDVLTGMLTGFLAHGYSSITAAIIGVYLHGLAGDIAKSQFGEEALLATDIIDNIGKAFLAHNV